MMVGAPLSLLDEMTLSQVGIIAACDSATEIFILKVNVLSKYF